MNNISSEKEIQLREEIKKKSRKELESEIYHLWIEQSEYASELQNYKEQVSLFHKTLMNYACQACNAENDGIDCVTPCFGYGSCKALRAYVNV